MFYFVFITLWKFQNVRHFIIFLNVSMTFVKYQKATFLNTWRCFSINYIAKKTVSDHLRAIKSCTELKTSMCFKNKK